MWTNWVLKQLMFKDCLLKYSACSVLSPNSLYVFRMESCPPGLRRNRCRSVKWRQRAGMVWANWITVVTAPPDQTVTLLMWVLNSSMTLLLCLLDLFFLCRFFMFVLSCVSYIFTRVLVILCITRIGFSVHTRNISLRKHTVLYFH